MAASTALLFVGIFFFFCCFCCSTASADRRFAAVRPDTAGVIDAAKALGGSTAGLGKSTELYIHGALGGSAELNLADLQLKSLFLDLLLLPGAKVSLSNIVATSIGLAQLNKTVCSSVAASSASALPGSNPIEVTVSGCSLTGPPLHQNSRAILLVQPISGHSPCRENVQKAPASISLRNNIVNQNTYIGKANATFGILVSSANLQSFTMDGNQVMTRAPYGVFVTRPIKSSSGSAVYYFSPRSESIVGQEDSFSVQQDVQLAVRNNQLKFYRPPSSYSSSSSSSATYLGYYAPFRGVKFVQVKAKMRLSVAVSGNIVTAAFSRGEVFGFDFASVDEGHISCAVSDNSVTVLFSRRLSLDVVAIASGNQRAHPSPISVGVKNNKVLQTSGTGNLHFAAWVVSTLGYDRHGAPQFLPIPVPIHNAIISIEHITFDATKAEANSWGTLLRSSSNAAGVSSLIVTDITMLFQQSSYNRGIGVEMDVAREIRVERFQATGGPCVAIEVAVGFERNEFGGNVQRKDVPPPAFGAVVVRDSAIRCVNCRSGRLFATSYAYRGKSEKLSPMEIAELNFWNCHVNVKLGNARPLVGDTEVSSWCTFASTINAAPHVLRVRYSSANCDADSAAFLTMNNFSAIEVRDSTATLVGRKVDCSSFSVMGIGGVAVGTFATTATPVPTMMVRNFSSTQKGSMTTFFVAGGFALPTGPFGGGGDGPGKFNLRARISFIDVSSSLTCGTQCAVFTLTKTTGIELFVGGAAGEKAVFSMVRDPSLGKPDLGGGMSQMAQFLTIPPVISFLRGTKAVFSIQLGPSRCPTSNGAAQSASVVEYSFSQLPADDMLFGDGVPEDMQILEPSCVLSQTQSLTKSRTSLSLTQPPIPPPPPTATLVPPRTLTYMAPPTMAPAPVLLLGDGAGAATDVLALIGPLASSAAASASAMSAAGASAGAAAGSSSTAASSAASASFQAPPGAMVAIFLAKKMSAISYMARTCPAHAVAPLSTDANLFDIRIGGEGDADPLSTYRGAVVSSLIVVAVFLVLALLCVGGIYLWKRRKQLQKASNSSNNSRGQRLSRQQMHADAERRRRIREEAKDLGHWPACVFPAFLIVAGGAAQAVGGMAGSSFGPPNTAFAVVAIIFFLVFPCGVTAFVSFKTNQEKTVGGGEGGGEENDENATATSESGGATATAREGAAGAEEESSSVGCHVKIWNWFMSSKVKWDPDSRWVKRYAYLIADRYSAGPSVLFFSSIDLLSVIGACLIAGFSSTCRDDACCKATAAAQLALAALYLAAFALMHVPRAPFRGRAFLSNFEEILAAIGGVIMLVCSAIVLVGRSVGFSSEDHPALVTVVILSTVGQAVGLVAILVVCVLPLLGLAFKGLRAMCDNMNVEDDDDDDSDGEEEDRHDHRRRGGGGGDRGHRSNGSRHRHHRPRLDDDSFLDSPLRGSGNGNDSSSNRRSGRYHRFHDGEEDNDEQMQELLDFGGRRGSSSSNRHSSPSSSSSPRHRQHHSSSSPSSSLARSNGGGGGGGGGGSSRDLPRVNDGDDRRRQSRSGGSGSSSRHQRSSSRDYSSPVPARRESSSPRSGGGGGGSSRRNPPGSPHDTGSGRHSSSRSGGGGGGSGHRAGSSSRRYHDI